MHLYLIRHGEFIGNLVPEDTPDGPLTARGRSEALALAETLRSELITDIIASPLMRALETATAIAQLSVQRFTVWKETYEYRTKGLYIGPSLQRLRQHYPLADFEANMETDGWVCGGIETPADVVERVRRMACRLRCDFEPNARVVLVAHGGFNSILLGVLLGIPQPHAVKFSQANCCINILQLTTERVHVQVLNKTDHLKFVSAPPNEHQAHEASAS